MGEAAKALGLSKGRISQLALAGTLDSSFVGGRKMVGSQSVAAYARNRRSGRPAKTIAQYMLMNATHEVMRVGYDATSDLPLTPIEIIDADRCPWGTVTRNASGKRRELNDWWRGRSIPGVRPGIDIRLAELQVSKTYDLPFRSYGLSLSDCYWMRPAHDDTTCWRDINFFENPFDLSHDEGWDFWLERVGLDSPDNTSEGALPKRWTIRGNERVLLKGCRTDDQRPLNEVVATALHRRLLADGSFVSCEAASTVDGPACACKNFLGVGEEYVPASALMATMGTVRGTSLYDRYCRYVGVLGLDETAYRSGLSQMIVCDALIANSDRHRRNFGLIRDVETLELRPAPLFDSGNCLWYAKTTGEVERRDWSFAVKPFGPVLEQQLALVEDASWFDDEALSGFADEACEILAQSAHATGGDRLSFIREGIERLRVLVSSVMSVQRWR